MAAARSELERSLGFLVSDVARLLRLQFDRRVQSLGLTQAQWRAIAHLAREEGLSQTALAERLEVKPITLARLIDRVEAAGWVRRGADEHDRRVTRLYLTPKSQPILDEMRARAAETIDAALEGLSAREREALVDALCRMKQNLTAPPDDRCAEEASRRKTRDG